MSYPRFKTLNSSKKESTCTFETECHKHSDNFFRSNTGGAERLHLNNLPQIPVIEGAWAALERSNMVQGDGREVTTNTTPTTPHTRRNNQQPQGALTKLQLPLQRHVNEC